jgi:hypothetical protein
MSSHRRPMRGGRPFDMYDDTRMPNRPEPDEQHFARDVGRRYPVMDPRLAEPRDMFQSPVGFPVDPELPFDSLFGMDPFFQDFRARTRNMMRGMDEMFASFGTAMANGGDTRGHYSFQSTSRVAGPDGVREESVYTVPGPDGMPSTRRVIRSPDGAEHVTVTRDGLPPEFQGDFGRMDMFPPFGPPRLTQGYYPRGLPHNDYDPPRIEELSDEDANGDANGDMRAAAGGAVGHAGATAQSGHRRMWDRDYWNSRWRR